VLEATSNRLVVYLHLTMDCNLRCRYCYSGAKRPERMTEEIARAAVEFFLKRTDRLEIRFFGGEPLLEFDLLKAIVAFSSREAARLKKHVHYITVSNGTLFTPPVFAFFREHRIDLGLSFDGCQTAQDANRVFVSGQGSFAAVERNIPNMLKLSPFVPVVAVVSPTNVHLLADSVRYLFDSGFRVISLSPDFTDPAFRENLPRVKAAYYQIAEIYIERLRQNRRVFINAFEPADSPLSRGRCQLGREDFSVDPNGDIYPCCCFVDQKAYRLGSVFDGIDVAEARLFLQEFAKLERHMETAHQNCPDNSFCKKGCGCTNMVTTGQLSRIDPIICECGRMEADVRADVREPLGRARLSRSG